MTTDEQITALNWYDFLGKLKSLLSKFLKKEDGIDGEFTVGGFIFTIKDGQIISKVVA